MTQLADRLAQADHHRRTGQLQQAQTIYRDLLHEDPTNAEAWCLLGAACRDRQEFDEAAKAYRKALALTPDAPNIHNSLGIVYAVWRRFADAEVCFQRALELKPDYARAFNNLGNALSEQRKLDEAVAAYKRARELGYTDLALDESLGLVLTRLGKLDDAETCFRTALAAKPEDGGVLSRLAIVLARKGDLDAAADAMRRTLRRPRADADVYLRLGDALTEKGKLDLAVRCFEKALQLAPTDHALLNHLATARLQQGMHDEARTFFRKAIAIRADDQWSRSSLLFVATNDPAADPEEVFDDHVTWARRHAPPPAVPPTFPNDRNPNRRLRVGYISPDFRRHPVGRFMESVLATHDKNRIEVFCYDEASRAPDEVGDRLRAAAHHWRVTKDKSHADVAAMIRADRIDVLVDLAGHTGNNRLGALAFRPAPVQVTYLGYPNTTGMGCIDYVLVDSVTQPAAEPAWFVEEPVRLGGGFCVYAPRDDAPPPGPLPAKQNGFVTFGLFHNLSKLNPALLALWARVLKAVPNAKLLVGRNSLSGETQVELRRRFAAAGLPDDRVEMRQLVAGPAAFLESYLPVDIALDTIPWSGHTTACDSLWMGVPVITLRGQTHAGRMVSSVLTHVGLPDWIAENPDQYVELAAKWACDLDGLANVRSGLREQMRRSKLCDAQNFTAHLEQAYQQMWKRYCARGAEPVALTDLVARADSLRKANRLELAEDGYRMVVRADPYHVEAWAWLGSLCHTQNRLDEAVAHYRRALHLRPQDPRSHNSLGILYAKLLRIQAAEACFRQSIDLDPEYAKAHNNLGNTLSEQGKLDEAAAAFRQAARLGFHDATLHLNLAIVESRQGFLDKAASSFHTALEMNPGNREAQSALLFLQNYDPNVRADRLLEEHRRWGEKQVPATPRAVHANDKLPDRPLRIGYVSPDFRSHPVGRFFEPILAAHDPEHVQVYCYDEAPFPPDSTTARLRRVAPNWRVTRGQGAAQLADAIRGDRIDVLIDLAGHTAHNRLDVFAVKPAPIQV
ncbi:MAG: tetratricopeptide repeat protein, partial [Gemmataceae bacterium]